jgi:hypothetical protein
VRLDPQVKKAIAAIPAQAWSTIEYPDAILDEDTGAWVSRAEVAEMPYTAFAAHKTQRIPGRVVVRRIPEFNPRAKAGQDALFRPGGSTPSLPPSRPT